MSVINVVVPIYYVPSQHTFLQLPKLILFLVTTWLTMAALVFHYQSVTNSSLSAPTWHSEIQPVIMYVLIVIAIIVTPQLFSEPWYPTPR